ncbi:MAG: heme exporter protein CcmB [Flavobacteriales bacterium]|nr:heme exporter protein CcmB [Flavobacteriales bacterium]
MPAVREIAALLKKEFTLEFRQKHAFAGVVIYVISTVFVCYLTLQKADKAITWSALVWITAIFTVFNALMRTFQAEGQGVQLYLYTLAHPRSIILAKMLYNTALVLVLNGFSLLLFMLFLGSDVLDQADMLQFLTGVILGSTGLACTVTFISGLAYKAGNNTGLMAILGFPVLIPTLLASTRFSLHALEGHPWGENGFQLLILVVLAISAVLLGALLFPYLWRE